MEEEITVRYAREEDIKVIYKLACELEEVIENKEGLDLSHVENNLKKIFKEDRAHFMVAEQGGEVSGFIHFTVRMTMLHSGPSAVVEEISVKKDRRGAGIGEKLLEEALNNCVKIGCSELEVTTEDTNENAKHFYRKMGFEKGGCLFEKHLT